MASGAFKLWAVDRHGKLIDYPYPPRGKEAEGPATATPEVPAGSALEAPAAAAPAAPAAEAATAPAAPAAPGAEEHKPETAEDLVAPDPARPEAFDIYFGVKDLKDPPPKDQVDLQDKVQKVLRTIQVLFITGEAAEAAKGQAKARNHAQFRSYYVRLYRLAQLGLEVNNVSPDIATVALATTISDLIDDEAVTVKRKHLRLLGRDAISVSFVCLILYILLMLTKTYWTHINSFLLTMGIQSSLAANFMLLLVGCFLGVWLSYGIRTTAFSLADLTVTDTDRLTPVIRLLFAGSLTLILGIVFAIPLVEVKIGSMSVTDIARYPMLAFVVGCFCGVSELALPTVVSKRASDFIKNIN